MSVQILSYTFEGPYRSAGSLRDAPGIYAILTRAQPGDPWNVVDVGESGTVRNRVANHDREDCWTRSAKDDGLAVAVLYTPGRTAAQRRAIEGLVRDKYQPACGIR